MDAAVERIVAAIREGRRFHVVTADAYAILSAHEDPEFRRIVGEADLVTADGAGVVWALRRTGRTATRVSGADLALRLVERSGPESFDVVFVGARPGVADEAAQHLRKRFPDCRIVATRHGFFGPDEDTAVAAEIAVLRPGLVLVGMGIPRQERFIAAALPLWGGCAAMGVGGSFDVYSGRVRRAPQWVQTLKMEWLWRTLSNPRKAYKIKRLPAFVWRVLRSPR